MNISREKLDCSIANLKQQLLDKRNADGHWEGRLSSSALSTATACCALAMAGAPKYSSIISKGVNWLAKTQNSDWGWGDTPDSISNLPTTLLCWASIKKSGFANQYDQTVENAKLWVAKQAGSTTGQDIVNAVDAIYGNDKTFSVPILTMCALCGLLGKNKVAWSYIKPLPFEFAVLPSRLFKSLKLSVVSYALPALIAIGQINYHHRKPINPFARMFRHLTKNKTLELLHKIQPANGGFLEATPLTSFVVMSLIGAGNGDCNVVKKGVDFLTASVREDGSWPIDTNLAAWVTTLSVNALEQEDLSSSEKKVITQWLLPQQCKQIHPYTNAEPGGWAWTDLPGGVPDADDTPGALLALHKLNSNDQHIISAAKQGIGWLMDLQNSDGGIPTFCKGWSKLDFDRSSPDLTSHTLAAMSAWIDGMDVNFACKMESSMCNMVDFLKHAQQDNGSWIPLWFGNQFSNNQQNPVYGTSRVLLGLSKLQEPFIIAIKHSVDKAVDYLLSVQNDDGGFGGDRAVPSSIEETALTVDALSNILMIAEYKYIDISKEWIISSITASVNWLLDKIENEQELSPSPIGLYFARLWYSEELYPLIFTISALQSVSKIA